VSEEEDFIRFFIANCPTKYIDRDPKKNLDPEDALKGFDFSFRICPGVSCEISCSLVTETTVTWYYAERSVTQASAAMILYKTIVEFAAQLEAKRISLIATTQERR
jgi:hypothetical protein